ncbi:MAG: hypothetical protein IPM51_00855 [Sphingobacteriaceae bacterium]|nr:hypothetical protein [Sphingobacteriaceae bacterium]
MKTLLLKNKIEVIGGGVGAVLGLAYWYFVGCSSGTCAITSNPYISTAYGAITGALMVGIFKDNKK